MKKEDFIKLGVSDELAQKLADASAEELKGFIPKSRFDEVNGELKTAKEDIKTRDGQLDALRNSSGDVEAMKEQIEALQADNKKKDETHAEEIAALRRSNIDDALLSGAKAKNLTAAKALLEAVDSKLDDEAYKVLRTEQIKKLTESDSTKFLFDSGSGKSQPQFRGFNPAEEKDGTPNPSGGTSLSDAVRTAFADANTK